MKCTRCGKWNGAVAAPAGVALDLCSCRRLLTPEQALTILQSSLDFQGRIALTCVNNDNETVLTDVGQRLIRAIERSHNIN